VTDKEYNAVFNLPFKEASSFFRQKLNIPTERWDDLWKDQHAKGFMSAGAMKADLLSDFRDSLQKAMDGQLTKKEFQSQFDTIVSKHGWSYNGSPGWRSALIYDTNVSTAYQAGRWQQFVEGGARYLRYVHADGIAHPRPLHLAWNGTTLPIDHPFWKTHYPPNGWRCHCRAVRADQGEVTDAPTAWSKINPATGAMDGIDKGWDYNVGQAADKSYKILGDKFETLPNDIARAWMTEHVGGPAFERFIEGRISGEFPVAVLAEADMMALDTTAQTVWFSQDSLLKNKGAIPARSKGHPELTLDDYRMIPEIIDRGEVYRQGDVKLIYLFSDGQVYRAALKRTKDGSENYFLSLFETTDKKNMAEVAAIYERIR
jgi:hypothetical protein